ncbi:GntR family transcriptional regulator [Bacillus sp. DTU_2020_1000418_1_SI_GHA_SEK_038]|uniref:GntR family transcriptional regulator n=1 Tax=Bacillus sp. DTU_2020_1000418_1_SI_GHA_SEK_038 TaxID=3077585 RepID=UPI0028EACCE9|nr:GntR family transcriptional regulator [Bacillus sp. DTU_2020_1000418_1_SI_GHA_SEK_038]WNS73539.1 GntR family transcriptional regulator [Bacillus sp. DTU_2020_1000418_1_SI_GHA_SEK_038]
MELDPKSPIPLHIQLKDGIQELINEGFYKEKIPSERELMDRYKVSRSTVREAVSHLVREGVLEKVHGKGTFISTKPIEEWLGNLTSTTDTIRKMGMKPDAKLIEHGRVIPPQEIIDTTGFQEAYYIKRIRYADDQPLAIEIQYYPVEIGEQLAKYDIDKGTLFDILEQNLHIKLSEAKQIITSSFLSKGDAELLGLPENTNVLNTERLLMDVDDQLIEYYIASFRADMYSFRINLSKKHT